MYRDRRAFPHVPFRAWRESKEKQLLAKIPSIYRYVLYLPYPIHPTTHSNVKTLRLCRLIPWSRLASSNFKQVYCKKLNEKYTYWLLDGRASIGPLGNWGRVSLPISPFDLTRTGDHIVITGFLHGWSSNIHKMNERPKNYAIPFIFDRDSIL